MKWFDQHTAATNELADVAHEMLLYADLWGASLDQQHFDRFRRYAERILSAKEKLRSAVHDKIDEDFKVVMQREAQTFRDIVSGAYNPLRGGADGPPPG